MPNTDDNSIQGFVLGDDIPVFRTTTGLPEGRTLAKAYMTLKPDDSDTTVDDDTKLWRKEITVIDNPGVGQILDEGSGAGDARSCRVRFDLVPDDTIGLIPLTEYFWDIQLKLDNGMIKTPWRGKLKGIRGITNKTT